MNHLHKLFFIAAITVGGLYILTPFPTKLKAIVDPPPSKPQTQMTGTNLFPIVNYDSPNFILKTPDKLDSLLKK